ncbi:phage tail tape measure protein [Pseudomonas yamanorum]|uniref:phage tail tape measure protein n=1 Tax=Pseudomonas yamanorum TaxID=515393 RepID=UPI002ED54A37|nr:phage tail tape measure protein [Pseudomonas yamanorum]
MNIAELGVKIDSADAIQAKTSLDEMAKAGGRAEQSAASLMNEMQALEKSLSTTAKTTQDLAKQRDALARLTKTGAYGEAEAAKISAQLDKHQIALAKSAMDEQKALNSLLGAIDPARGALAKLDTQVEQLGKHLDAGRISQDQYNTALSKIDKDYAKLERTTTGFDKLRLGTRQAQENVVQLGNALSSGDWGSGVRAVAQLGAGAGASAGSLLALVAPIGLVAAAIGGLTYAYYSGNKETDAFNKALILTGNFARATSGQLSDMSRQVSAVVGTTGAAADVLATLAGSGKLASGSFVEIAEAALSMEKATGKSIDSTVAEFVKIADDPVAAAKSLNEQYHFLTASVYSQIVALKDQGDEIGATKLLTDTYADTVQTRSRQVLDNLNLWERAWLGIKSAASGALDGISDVGRQKTYNDQIKELQSKLTGSDAFDVGGTRMNAQEVSPKVRAQIQAQITFLTLQRDADDARIKYFDDQGKAQQAAIVAGDKIDALTKSSLTNEQKRAEALKDYKRQLDDIRKVSPDDPRLAQATIDKNISNINDKFKDPKAAANQVDLTGFNNAKNNLAAIVDEYKNTQKRLDAAEKAGLISQAEYAVKREALIGNQRDEVTAAYEAEIAALEAVKGKKATTAAQSIQLDQKIADARAGMVKAQKEADSQLEVLATNETGRLAKQERSITTYVQALAQQQRALELAGQRAVLGVGQGDRQNALNGELNSQQDRFAQQSLELDNQKSDPSRNMSEEEFKRKSQALADANKAATDQIRQNYADVEAAQGDWTKGATSAWANYLDSAKNIAGQTKSLFGNAFSSMEDAVVNFAMTGKASFSDFAKSILADMARIATRQASSALLSSLVGATASYFGGGGGSGGASQAGYTGTDLSNFTPGSIQAKGGAWSGGVQMFADGGAFTNTIATGPTLAPMALFGEAGPEAIMPLTRTANGKLGVMSVGGGVNLSLSMPIILTDQEAGRPDGAEFDAELFQRNMETRTRQIATEEIAKSWRQGGVSSRNVKG